MFTDWDLKLQQTMVEMFPLRSEDAAYNKIKGMLSTLGDPFTRIISPKVLLADSRVVRIDSLYLFTFSLSIDCLFQELQWLHI